jgi:hypothetical protein
VSVFLLATAVASLVGAAIAVGAREARLAALGLAVVLTASALVVEPAPAPAAVGFRLVAGILAAYLVQVAARRQWRTVGSPLGVPATLVGGFAVFVLGLGASPLVLHFGGPVAAGGAGLAMLAVAAAPVAIGRDAFRVGSGLLVAATGVFLVRVALGGTPGDLEFAAEGLVLAVLASVVLVLVYGAAAATEGVAIPAEEDPRRGAMRLARRVTEPVLGSRMGR